MRLYAYDHFHNVVSKMVTHRTMVVGPIGEGEPLPPELVAAEHACIIIHAKPKMGRAGVTQQYDKIIGTFWCLT